MALIRMLPVLASAETFAALADLPEPVVVELINACAIPTIQIAGLTRVRVKEALRTLCGSQSDAPDAEGRAQGNAL